MNSSIILNSYIELFVAILNGKIPAMTVDYRTPVFICKYCTLFSSRKDFSQAQIFSILSKIFQDNLSQAFCSIEASIFH